MNFLVYNLALRAVGINGHARTYVDSAMGKRLEPQGVGQIQQDSYSKLLGFRYSRGQMLGQP